MSDKSIIIFNPHGKGFVFDFTKWDLQRLRVKGRHTMLYICYICTLIFLSYCIVFIILLSISKLADSEYYYFIHFKPIINIKTIIEQKSEITDDGHAASSIEQLVPYFQENYNGINVNKIWCKEALMYHWCSSYDPIELTNNKKYWCSVLDTWFHQRLYIENINQRCIGYMAAKKGYPWS